MANVTNVGDFYPVFNRKDKRAHFENPISSDVDTNPDRYELVEYFYKKPGINADMTIDPDADDATALVAYVIANRDFEILGSNASTDDVTFSSTHAGLLLTVDTAGDKDVIILPHLNTGQTAWTNIKWGTENQVIWEAVIRTGAAIASTIIWAGLKTANDHVVGIDNDECFFRYDDSEAKWSCHYAIDNSDTEVVSNVTVAINTTYYLRIEIDADRIATYYINDKAVAQSTALKNNIDFIPYIGVNGNNVTLHVIKQKISRVIYESS